MKLNKTYLLKILPSILLGFILYLFLALPLSIFIQNTLISIFILLICFITSFYLIFRFIKSKEFLISMNILFILLVSFLLWLSQIFAKAYSY